MKATMCRMTLALASMLVCMGTAQAEDLNYSELEARLAKIESHLASQNSLQQAGYCCDSCGESSCGCESSCCDGCCNGCSGCCDCCSSCGGCGGYYAQVDLVFARAHVLEDAGPGGKLSEEYELAPRFILGYENCCGQGLRARYWHYGHDSRNLTVAADAVRFEFDVIDLEATNRFQFCRTDVTLAGGFRYAHLEIVEDDVAETDLVGLTVAADVETLVCCDCCSYWSAIYGARAALLYGDWDSEGGANGFIGADIRDDSVAVTEVYAGAEYGCCYCGYDIYTQLKIELQHWHSDALAQNAGADSINFVGPTWTFGVGF